MPSKKTFTDSDGAVERFFINNPKEQAVSAAETPSGVDPQTEEVPQEAQPAQKTPVMSHTQDSYDPQQTPDVPMVNAPAAGEKGLRKERIGLLLDAQLKEDLSHLSKATGRKSLNDFLVTILAAYVESPESREKLTQYRRLLQD